MSRIYDNWEKLVGAVLDREELRRLALCDSFSSSISTDFSTRCSFDSVDDDNAASLRQSNFLYRVVRLIELKEIIKATKNFRPDMFKGEGAFCRVFRAWIDEHTLTASEPGSGMDVSVKMWHQNKMEKLQDWLKEINYLVQLHHPNLVGLIRYCMEEDNMILVYEFMQKGSLENDLFKRGHQSLSWATRIKVALDVARGLSYLHGREIPVIHRDFRTPNILLDGEFKAKLANYCYGTDDPTSDMNTISTDQFFATHGYTAPEAKDQLSTKSNVYSFGAILLELLSGISAPNLSWAKPYFSKKRKLLQIMDVRLEGQYSHDAAYKVAKLALKCLSLDPKLRPSMADVVVALEQLQRL